MDNLPQEQPLPVWVVIPTWNRREDVLACLESVIGSNYPVLRVVVVDNGSTDGSSVMISKNYPQVDLIILEKNQGASVASNKGVTFALEGGAQYILRLDSDVIIDKEMISVLVENAQADPNCGILFPKILRFDKSDMIWYTGASSHPFLLIARVDQYNIADNLTNQTNHKVDYVPSTVILITREAYQSVNGFDEDYFVYYEDFDFCKKVRKSGKTILYIPKAKAWHKIESEKLSDFGIFHLSRGRVIFYRKHSAGFHQLLLMIYSILYIFYRVIFKVPREPVFPAIRGWVSGLKQPLSVKTK